jgi:hypothetical protein
MASGGPINKKGDRRADIELARLACKEMGYKGESAKIQAASHLKDVPWSLPIHN